MREGAARKARRLLAAGDVHVLQATDSAVRARVRGDGGVYEVRWDHGDWSCSCPALSACSHREAVRLVTLAPVPRFPSVATQGGHAQ